MWGSDLIADAIADLGFEFAAINPGASYRGLHDSLVNHLDQRVPLIVCLHEEHAVALAHGWTKVTGRPALAIVHSNVGLMHAVMPLYNAWVDRAPVVLLNAGGPRDAVRRRPWIEWIHSVQDPGALVRPFTKWDDQPGSAAASCDALAEATFIAGVEPKGPTFICLDVADQEDPVEGGRPTVRPLVEARRVVPCGDAIARVVERLSQASRIVILAGRTTRCESAWAARIDLAERLGAAVFTDIKTAAAFPTAHPQHCDGTTFALDSARQEILRQADAVISLDWIDLEGTLRAANADPYLVAASLDVTATRGWVRNGFRQPAADALFPVTSDVLVEALLAALTPKADTGAHWWRDEAADTASQQEASLTDAIAYSEIADAIEDIRAEMPVAITRYPLGWPNDHAVFNHPLDYLGRDGGEGLGSGPGMAIGAALALKDTGRLAIGVIGDGDFMMGATALWTAANLGLPLLLVVAANGVYGNDVVHQERVARTRSRPLESRWIGQRIDEPRIDIAAMARAQGVRHAVCVPTGKIRPALVEAARYAMTGHPAVVEIEMPALETTQR